MFHRGARGRRPGFPQVDREAIAADDGIRHILEAARRGPNSHTDPVRTLTDTHAHAERGLPGCLRLNTSVLDSEPYRPVKRTRIHSPYLVALQSAVREVNDNSYIRRVITDSSTHGGQIYRRSRNRWRSQCGTTGQDAKSYRTAK